MRKRTGPVDENAPSRPKRKTPPRGKSPERPLIILFAASEMAPFCKTGGLADVIGSLPPVLAAMGHEVHVALPGYAAIDRAGFGFIAECGRFQLTVGPVTKPVTVSTTAWKGVSVHLIENEEYFDRPGLYGDEKGDYFDNGPRFVLFSRGVLETAKCIGLRPDIIHSHDWQAGLVSTYLRAVYAEDDFFQGTKTLFTIHNLGYQGIFPPWVFSLAGIPETEFDWLKMEYYGNVSFLKSGIVYSDAVSTVSPTYAREITSEPLGFGLQGVLAGRRGVLHGILNGIDPQEWDPSSDHTVPAHFGPDAMAGKAVCRTALLAAYGIESDETVPIIGMVTRLDSQKGLDIIEEAAPILMTFDIRLIVLGTGTREHCDALESLAAKYPGRIVPDLRFDTAAARLIYAGSDAFLMPSRYEPCGLGQMIALRYGTLPIVHATGGLADTVTDIDQAPGRGFGFVFEPHTAGALIDAVERAVRAFREPGRPRWNEAVVTGMAVDFSWERSADRYVTLYRTIASPGE